MAVLGLGLAPTLGPRTLGAPPQPKTRSIAYNRRNFLVPFNIPAADVPRYKQVQLWASADAGRSWTKVAVTSPDKPFFNFTAKTDGDFLFATRTVDTQNRLYPADDSDIEPNMKVTIDTKKPIMSIEPRARRGNVASIAWDVTDELLALDTLTFDYQTEGSTEWIPIAISKPARIGVESWDAGTSEPVVVRGSVADLAENRQVVKITLPGGGVPDDAAATAPADRGDANTPPAIDTFASSVATRPPTANPAPRRDPAENSGGFDPFSAGAADRPGGADPAAALAASATPPIPVASPKFALQYAVDDAGPNGPAVVELFVTNDGGRTWASRGEDPDRTSPFVVDLGGEGRYGLKLVAKSAANQGDRPPVPGEVPQTTVDVDTSGPAVTLEPPRLAGNRLIIAWQASDPHPASRPVMISIRADAPDARWQIITPTPVENTGQYSWLIPAKCPPKIHVRVDVRDALGNLGFAETAESGPVVVDRSKPKGRILGLDANARPLR